MWIYWMPNIEYIVDCRAIRFFITWIIWGSFTIWCLILDVFVFSFYRRIELGTFVLNKRSLKIKTVSFDSETKSYGSNEKPLIVSTILWIRRHVMLWWVNRISFLNTWINTSIKFLYCWYYKTWIWYEYE